MTQIFGSSLWCFILRIQLFSDFLRNKLERVTNGVLVSPWLWWWFNHAADHDDIASDGGNDESIEGNDGEAGDDDFAGDGDAGLVGDAGDDESIEGNDGEAGAIRVVLRRKHGFA